MFVLYSQSIALKGRAGRLAWLGVMGLVADAPVLLQTTAFPGVVRRLQRRRHSDNARSSRRVRSDRRASELHPPCRRRGKTWRTRWSTSRARRRVSLPVRETTVLFFPLRLDRALSSARSFPLNKEGWFFFEGVFFSHSLTHSQNALLAFLFLGTPPGRDEDWLIYGVVGNCMDVDGGRSLA